MGKLFSKTATAADLGSTVTVTSKNADGTTYFVKSDVTLASYRGVGNPAISASAVASADPPLSTVHPTPDGQRGPPPALAGELLERQVLGHHRVDRACGPDPARRGDRDRQQPHVVAADRQQRRRRHRQPGWVERHR